MATGKGLSLILSVLGICMLCLSTMVVTYIYEPTVVTTVEQREQVNRLIRQLRIYEPPPKIVHIEVVTRPDSIRDTVLGSYNAGTKIVTIYYTNISRKRELNEMVDTYFHELRHAVQDTSSHLRYRRSIKSTNLKDYDSYYNSWHEKDARRYGEVATRQFLRYYRK